MRKFFGLLMGCLMLLSVVCVFGENVAVAGKSEIFVTSVKKMPAKTGEKATIVLNDCLEVRDILVSKADGKVNLKYPTYVSKAGKEYPQLEVISEQAKMEIEKAIATGKPSEKASKTLTFKVSKFSKMRKSTSSMKAFVSVDFNNAVRVECKVMESKKGPWISWPSVKDEKTGKYLKQILLINANVKNVVENSLLKKYKDSGEEQSEEGSVTEEK